MTKDLKNKFTTFMILLFASVLLLVVSLFSDYKGKSSKQMDNDAIKIAEMDAINSKQAFIISQMDSIDRKLKNFEPTATDAAVQLNDIDKDIKDLKNYFEKNNLKESAYTGIIDNYNLMLRDKDDYKNTVLKNSLVMKKAEECAENLKINKQALTQAKIMGIQGGKKEE